MEDLRRNAMNYGVYLGLLLIVFTSVIYAIDINYFTSFWVGMVMMVIVVVLAILATTKHKKSIGGFINFRESFSSFAITVIIGYFISTLFTIILFNFIDPEAKTIMTENLIKYTAELMQNFGAKAADINEAIKQMKESDAYGVAGQLKGFATNIVVYSIIGLISALIIKRDRPQSL